MSNYDFSFVRNTLKDALCALCLSQNRRCAANWPLLQCVSEYVPKLLEDFDADHDKICWECSHRLKQMLRFIDQVQQARRNLENIVNAAGAGDTFVLHSLSKLSRTFLRGTVFINPSPQYNAQSATTIILPSSPHNTVQSAANIILNPSISLVQNVNMLVNGLKPSIHKAGEAIVPARIKRTLVAEPIYKEDETDSVQEMKLEQESEQYLQSENIHQKLEEELDNSFQSNDIQQEFEHESNHSLHSKDIHHKFEQESDHSFQSENMQLKVELQSDDSMQSEYLDLGIIEEAEINEKLLSPNTSTSNSADIDKITNGLIMQKNTVKEVNHFSKTKAVDTNLKIRSDLSHNQTPCAIDNVFKRDKTEASNTDFKITVITKDMFMKLREKERKNIVKSTGFHCDKCVMNIQNEYAYKLHMAQHDLSAGSEVCDICEMRFETAETLMLHTQLHYKVLECCRCRDSPFICRFWSAMNSHLKLHDNPQSLHCAYCGTVYETPTALDAHIAETKHPLTCPQCEGKERTFISAQGLVNHSQNFHTTYRCKKCHLMINGHKNLQLHEESAHSQSIQNGQIHLKDGVEEWYCAECKLFFNSRSSFAYHMKWSKIHCKGKFECDHCGRSYNEKGTLAWHMKISHLRTASFCCEVCGKNFQTRSKLKRHQETVHDKKRPPKNLICDSCGKGFATMQNLTQHRRSHTGDRPYECDQCEWKFAAHASLWKHVRLKHMDRDASKDLREMLKRSNKRARRKGNVSKKRERKKQQQTKDMDKTAGKVLKN